MSRGKSCNRCPLSSVQTNKYAVNALGLTYRCRSLKRELVRAQEEIKRIQSVPLVIGQFMEAIDQK